MKDIVLWLMIVLLWSAFPMIAIAGDQVQKPIYGEDNQKAAEVIALELKAAVQRGDKRTVLSMFTYPTWILVGCGYRKAEKPADLLPYYDLLFSEDVQKEIASKEFEVIGSGWRGFLISPATIWFDVWPDNKFYIYSMTSNLTRVYFNHEGVTEECGDVPNKYLGVWECCGFKSSEMDQMDGAALKGIIGKRIRISDHGIKLLDTFPELGFKEWTDRPQEITYCINRLENKSEEDHSELDTLLPVTAHDAFGLLLEKGKLHFIAICQQQAEDGPLKERFEVISGDRIVKMGAANIAFIFKKQKTRK